MADKKLHTEQVQFKVETTASASGTVKRGQQSWNLFLIFLGFALTIEGSAISMLDELLWWARLLIFAVIGSLTWWAFMHWGWWQNKFLGWYSRNADEAR